jgi:hypothetical protein
VLVLSDLGLLAAGWGLTRRPFGATGTLRSR